MEFADDRVKLSTFVGAMMAIMAICARISIMVIYCFFLFFLSIFLFKYLFSKLSKINANQRRALMAPRASTTTRSMRVNALTHIRARTVIKSTRIPIHARACHVKRAANIVFAMQKMITFAQKMFNKRN